MDSLSLKDIENIEGKRKYLAKLNQIKVMQMYMFCCGSSNSNYRITFPAGIILEKYNEENEHMNSIMKSIKSNISCGYIGNPFVIIDKIHSLPRLIFNKRNG